MKGEVRFDHVSKRFRLGASGSLRGALAGWLSRGRDQESQRRELWALRDVSFALEPGASLGLIGPNGSGKTTTLKLLSMVTYPTTGKIALSGRVSSLIELGAGFHPELTGRENIYLNGAILGLKRHEITQKLDAIIAFSELERFIDTPVKRYSSGMYVRLGFAVAAHVEPDILVVDEVLAVGDARFRHRCIQHMRQLQRRGTTILFVSHNMHLVRDICDTALLLVKGQILAQGEPVAVIAEYEKALLSIASADTASDEPREIDAQSQGRLFLTAIDVLASTPDTNESLPSALPATVRIHYRATAPIPIGRIDIRMVRDEDSTLCSAADSVPSARVDPELHNLSDSGVIEATYDPLQVTSGRYIIIVRITDPSDCVVLASGQSRPFQVYTAGDVPEPGVFIPNIHWAHEPLQK